MARPLSYKSKSQRLYHLPPRGSDWHLFRRHFDTVIDYDSPARREMEREWSAWRAFYLSKQWLELNKNAMGLDRAVRWRDPDPRNKIPRPVNNEVYPLIENETAKIARRKSVPYVRPIALQEGAIPGLGPQVADDILEWHLETINWPRKRRSNIFKNNLYGTGFLWSYLDQNYMDSVKIGITEARRCSMDHMLASPDLPPDFPTHELAANKGYYRTVDNFDPSDGTTSRSYTATACPVCGSSLEEFRPMTGAPEEDLFGRPLFKPVPKNQPNIEVVPPHDIFVENEGIGFDLPQDVNEWYRRTPRHIEHWVAAHYPDALEEVKPDDPEEIFEHHPVSGEYSHSAADSATNRPVWRNHALVDTAIIKPCPSYPMGRYVEMAGNVLLRDEDLYRKARYQPDTIIPLVVCTATRFIVKDGELYGQSPIAVLASPQKRINMTLSQLVDIRQRNLVSGVMVTDDTVLTSGWVEGYAGRVLKYRPSTQYPQHQPQLLQGHTADAGVYNELNHSRDFMQNAVGAQDVDIGKAPRNISAASAIQMLQESAMGRREGRLEEMIDAFKEVFSHQLLLLCEFAVEPRVYRARAANGKYEYRQFKGLDLAGHTDVMVEEQASYDARAFEREVLIQAVNMGVVVISTPSARREAAKTLGVNQKIADEENAQISDAESKWYSFKDQGLVPAIDESIDDHWIMFSVYGRFLKSYDGQELATQYGWPQMLPIIYGWEEKLKGAQALHAQITQLNAAAMRGDPSAQLNLIVLQQSSGEPIENLMLPRAIDQQILYVWARMGIDVNNPYARFRAVVEGHRLRGETKKFEAQSQPRFNAPGGAQTSAGTEPVVGAGSIPGPGEESAGMPLAVGG